VKKLKELDVAGPATAEEIKKGFFVQWHLTERCNLACRHCYQSGNGTAEMGLSAIRETAEEVAEMLADWAEKYAISFRGSFNVTGGEPLVRKEQGFEISLLTNGTLVDREKAEKLSGLVRVVQVSIEGPEPVHDAIRGKGAYKKALTGVENMLASGIFVSLNITISRLNAEYLSDLVLLGRELGVGRVGFSRLVPRGRGAALAEEMVDGEQLRQIYLSLLSLGDEAMETGTGDPLAALLYDETPDAGDISPSGDAPQVFQGSPCFPMAPSPPAGECPSPSATWPGIRSGRYGPNHRSSPCSGTRAATQAGAADAPDGRRAGAAGLSPTPLLLPGEERRPFSVTIHSAFPHWWIGTDGSTAGPVSHTPATQI